MRPASFRGVGFFVESGDTRQQLFADEHTFPDRDQAERSIAVDRKGQGPTRFVIKAFLAGDDYMERRDALEAALREPRPGRLVHPWRGERTVSIVGEIHTREHKNEGGFCSISFTCVDVSETGLTSGADTEAIADRDLDAFIEETALDFDQVTAVTDVPNAYLEPTTSAWSEATAALEEAHGKLTQALGVVDDYAERVEGFVDDLDAFASAPGAAARALLGAIQAVAELPGEVIGALEDGVAEFLGAGEAVLRAFEDLVTFGADASPLVEVTPNGVAAARFRAATFRLIRQGAWAAGARALLEVPFGSRDEALTTLAESDDVAEDLLTDSEGPGGTSVGGAEVYATLTAARVSLIRHLQAAAAELPEIVTHEPAVTVPALVLAHDLFGDATRAAEIVERNDPPHPGEIPAGTALEVLRD
ncbi:MAG: DNA circularization N-terminal domain-containing protein [Deltaproteobacteria bacterium]|nr:DNA circularization N-terminal domain-containing protein [Deltaproteobacteria bacterium]